MLIFKPGTKYFGGEELVFHGKLLAMYKELDSIDLVVDFVNYNLRFHEPDKKKITFWERQIGKHVQFISNIDDFYLKREDQWEFEH